MSVFYSHQSLSCISLITFPDTIVLTLPGCSFLFAKEAEARGELRTMLWGYWLTFGWEQNILVLSSLALCLAQPTCVRTITSRILKVNQGEIHRGSQNSAIEWSTPSVQVKRNILTLPQPLRTRNTSLFLIEGAFISHSDWFFRVLSVIQFLHKVCFSAHCALGLHPRSCYFSPNSFPNFVQSQKNGAPFLHIFLFLFLTKVSKQDRPFTSVEYFRGCHVIKHIIWIALKCTLAYL